MHCLSVYSTCGLNSLVNFHQELIIAEFKNNGFLYILHLYVEIYRKKGEGSPRCGGGDVIQLAAGEAQRETCCAIRMWDRIAH